MQIELICEAPHFQGVVATFDTVRGTDQDAARFCKAGEFHDCDDRVAFEVTLPARELAALICRVVRRPDHDQWGGDGPCPLQWGWHTVRVVA